MIVVVDIALSRYTSWCHSRM